MKRVSKIFQGSGRLLSGQKETSQAERVEKDVVDDEEDVLSSSEEEVLQESPDRQPQTAKKKTAFQKIAERMNILSPRHHKRRRSASDVQGPTAMLGFSQQVLDLARDQEPMQLAPLDALRIHRSHNDFRSLQLTSLEEHGKDDELSRRLAQRLGGNADPIKSQSQSQPHLAEAVQPWSTKTTATPEVSKLAPSNKDTAQVIVQLADDNHPVTAATNRDFNPFSNSITTTTTDYEKTHAPPKTPRPRAKAKQSSTTTMSALPRNTSRSRASTSAALVHLGTATTATTTTTTTMMEGETDSIPPLDVEELLLSPSKLVIHSAAHGTIETTMTKDDLASPLVTKVVRRLPNGNLLIAPKITSPTATTSSSTTIMPQTKRESTSANNKKKNGKRMLRHSKPQLPTSPPLIDHSSSQHPTDTADMAAEELSTRRSRSRGKQPANRPRRSQERSRSQQQSQPPPQKQLQKELERRRRRRTSVSHVTPVNQQHPQQQSLDETEAPYLLDVAVDMQTSTLLAPAMTSPQSSSLTATKPTKNPTTPRQYQRRVSKSHLTTPTPAPTTEMQEVTTPSGNLARRPKSHKQFEIAAIDATDFHLFEPLKNRPRKSTSNIPHVQESVATHTAEALAAMARCTTSTALTSAAVRDNPKGRTERTPTRRRKSTEKKPSTRTIGSENAKDHDGIQPNSSSPSHKSGMHQRRSSSQHKPYEESKIATATTLSTIGLSLYPLLKSASNISVVTKSENLPLGQRAVSNANESFSKTKRRISFAGDGTDFSENFEPNSKLLSPMTLRQRLQVPTQVLNVVETLIAWDHAVYATEQSFAIESFPLSMDKNSVVQKVSRVSAKLPPTIKEVLQHPRRRALSMGDIASCNTCDWSYATPELRHDSRHKKNKEEQQLEPSPTSVLEQSKEVVFSLDFDIPTQAEKMATMMQGTPPKRGNSSKIKKHYVYEAMGCHEPIKWESLASTPESQRDGLKKTSNNPMCDGRDNCSECNQTELAQALAKHISSTSPSKLRNQGILDACDSVVLSKALKNRPSVKAFQSDDFHNDTVPAPGCTVQYSDTENDDNREKEMYLSQARRHDDGAGTKFCTVQEPTHHGITNVLILEDLMSNTSTLTPSSRSITMAQEFDGSDRGLLLEFLSLSHPSNIVSAKSRLDFSPRKPRKSCSFQSHVSSEAHTAKSELKSLLQIEHTLDEVASLGDCLEKNLPAVSGQARRHPSVLPNVKDIYQRHKDDSNMGTRNPVRVGSFGISTGHACATVDSLDTSGSVIASMSNESGKFSQVVATDSLKLLFTKRQATQKKQLIGLRKGVHPKPRATQSNLDNSMDLSQLHHSMPSRTSDATCWVDFASDERSECVQKSFPTREARSRWSSSY